MAKTVIAFGAFDILHPGHLSYLEKAKRLGDRLVVVVGRDSSIRLFKKREPVFSERQRLRIIRALKPVDLAILGKRIVNSDSMFLVLRKYKPDVIALGYDQPVDMKELRDRLRKYGINARVVRIGIKRNERFLKSSRLRKLL